MTAAGFTGRNTPASANAARLALSTFSSGSEPWKSTSTPCARQTPSSVSR
jgi:hypothetical protein